MFFIAPEKDPICKNKCNRVFCSHRFHNHLTHLTSSQPAGNGLNLTGSAPVNLVNSKENGTAQNRAFSRISRKRVIFIDAGNLTPALAESQRTSPVPDLDSAADFSRLDAGQDSFHRRMRALDGIGHVSIIPENASFSADSDRKTGPLRPRLIRKM